MEKMVTNPDYDEYIKDVIRGHEAEVESMLYDTSTHLGEGRTAFVSFLNFKARICMKIYKKSEDIIDVDFYLSPAKEEVFLEKLKHLNTRARVPVVYSCFEDTDNNSHDFLMMEALSAVSIDDILQGRVPIPENFNLDSFQADLFEFVEKMHEQNIYHRDLHEGNIMIDSKTGQVYIIDFGAATEFFGQVEPGERGPYHITKNGQDIILTSDEAKVKSVIKALRGKLTSAS